MKALTLYIDKWYIIGAVCIDGVPRLITPSNGEERFWLYFYEDVANERIVYGEDYKQYYHNNANHYYGDVFNLISDSTAYFMRFGKKQEMYKIFKASGLLDKLKETVGEGSGDIETYISFSKDISDAARLVFLQSVLQPDRFIVKESVARIGHLALEHAFRGGRYDEDGYYVLLNACNENLLYSVYEHTDKILLRKAEGRRNGMGADLRSRALLEKVVKIINQRNHFLDSEQDYEREYLRLGQFVDQWIVKLENARAGRPITISEVRFSKFPNTYDVTVLKKDIDERTHVIVDDIVREITAFVKNLNIPNHKVKGVVFLGNTFTNEQFIRAIEERYLLSNDKFVFYKESELPNIVAVYSVMDCTQFSEATRMAFANGATELERKKLAQEEESRRKDAERKKAEQEARDKAAHESENKYKEALANVYDYEKKRDYVQMSDWADIALQHKPDDTEAQQKKADATRLLSEKRVKEEQYKSIIQRAQRSLKEKQWQDALAQSDAALNLMPHSKEAERIHEVARKQIDSQVQIEKYLTRADMFLAQKSYSEALGELKKVLSFDSENKDAQERINKIEQAQEEHNRKVNKLIQQYQAAKENNGFDAAITACSELIDVDTPNQRKWTEIVERLKSEKAEFVKGQEKWQNLKRKIDAAIFMEKWSEVVALGQEALKTRPDDDDLRVNVRRAEEKLAVLTAEKKYKQSIYQVKDFIVDKRWSEAKDLLSDLQIEFPSHNGEMKMLFKQIFDAETAFEKQHGKTDTSSQNDRPVKIKGFNPQQDTLEDDFFGTPKEQKRKARNSPKQLGQKDDNSFERGNAGKGYPKNGHQKKRSTTPNAMDDFFDNPPTNNKVDGNSLSKSINEDFNF